MRLERQARSFPTCMDSQSNSIGSYLCNSRLFRSYLRKQNRSLHNPPHIEGK
ncbi:unnamed protein product [Periconia digitata]|uniref:Uncharacterized protein n=1 Tax=Periconia digitata TaxID=1303443 RepID=A0A9W4UQ71_9PLEO|nr:unnamed protein product [Periconia digitata]